MKRLIVTGAIVLASSSMVFAAEKQANLGFEYGVSMQSFKDSHFSSGSGSFFRLNLKVDDALTYFVHSENGTFTASDSNSTTSNSTHSNTVNQSIMGVGAKMTFENDISASLMVGSTTLNGYLNARNSTSQTAQVADVGVNWEKTKGNVSLSTGLTYRHVTLPHSIAIDTKSINDLTSTNLNIAIKYSF